MKTLNLIKAHVVSAAALIREAAQLADEQGVTLPATELEAAVNHLQAAINALKVKEDCPHPRAV